MEPDVEESADSDNNNPDEIEPDLEVEVPLADFKAYTQRRPNNNLGQLDGLNGLRTCHLNWAYDWSLHVKKYSLNFKGWGQLQAENPIEQTVNVSLSAKSLNLK